MEKRLPLFSRFWMAGDGLGAIRDFRNNDYIRAGRNSRVQRQPACLMPHDLHNEHTRMRERGRMDGIDDRCRDIDRGLEAKRHLRPPQVIIDRLGQRHHMNAMLGQQIRGLVRAVAAQNHQTVEFGLLNGFEHFLELGFLVLLRLEHGFERLARGAKNGAAHRQDIRKIGFLHLMVISLDQPAVAVPNPVQGQLVPKFVIQRLRHAAQRGVQALAVAAACQHSDSHGSSSSHSFLYPYHTPFSPACEELTQGFTQFYICSLFDGTGRLCCFFHKIFVSFGSCLSLPAMIS